jgi:MFS family permease
MPPTTSTFRRVRRPGFPDTGTKAFIRLGLRPRPNNPFLPDHEGVLVLVLVAQVLVVLDISVVNTALPTIGRSLDLKSADMQWMVTAYLLMSGGGLLLGGRVADLLPRRRVLMIGMLTFTAATLFSGFASSANELVAARGVQGVGAAQMTPAALSIIMTAYEGAQRARGLALWGAIGGLGIAAGVIVGGALTTWAGW